MKMTVTKEFTFDAAHHLTKYYGKCERIHGHTYKLLVTVSGEIQKNDMIIDFIILKRVVNKHILQYLDHHDLNEILDNPTTESLALWIWKKLENLEQLLLEEVEDPNLDEEIKKYLMSNDQIDKSHAKENTKIKLEKITLHESLTSFVTLSK